jgi:hypothetical protein
MGACQGEFMGTVESGRRVASSVALPEWLRSLFWDHDFSVLDWRQDRELVIGRVLEAGTWDAIQWLRRQAGDAALRDWILRHQGRCLSSEQIRFWELILDLPPETVDGWLQSPERRIWEDRQEDRASK